MKPIKAYIHKYYTYDIVQALEREGISLISPIDVRMPGRDTSTDQREISTEAGGYMPMTKLESTVKDELVPAVTSGIRQLAQTGDHGLRSDGCIIVSNIDGVMPVASSG